MCNSLALLQAPLGSSIAATTVLLQDTALRFSGGGWKRGVFVHYMKRGGRGEITVQVQLVLKRPPGSALGMPSRERYICQNQIEFLNRPPLPWSFTLANTGSVASTAHLRQVARSKEHRECQSGGNGHGCHPECLLTSADSESRFRSPCAILEQTCSYTSQVSDI